jgi:hypothetical protein
MGTVVENRAIMEAALAAVTEDEMRRVHGMIERAGPPKVESAEFTEAYYQMETPLCVEVTPGGGYYPLVGKRLNRITAPALIERLWDECGLTDSAPLPKLELVESDYIGRRFGNAAESLYMPELHSLFISRAMCSTWFVTHETAHAVSVATLPVNQWDAHGPRFASIFAEMLTVAIDPITAGIFTAGYATL